jgi:carbamoyltransferase
VASVAEPIAVLGVSAEYHDAAAAVLVDGEIVAAAEEERFTRVKHDASLPRHAIAWCLEAAHLVGEPLTVAFYDKPFTTWERIVATHGRVGPRGFPAMHQALAPWVRSKLWVRYRLERLLAELGHPTVRVVFAEHHQSHAAAAFHPSGYESAAILTFDGVGEWATSSIAHGRGHQIEVLREQRFPDSLGLFYSAMTSFCGFEVNDGEYKLMGLAPYGQPVYAEQLLHQVIQVHDDGSVHLDQRWFDYRAGARMTRPRLGDLLDGPARPLGAEPGQREADIAASTQHVLERAVLGAARHAHRLTGERRAVLAGGVALNCVANRRLLEDGPFDELWVQPAAGDAGSALGAALWSWHQIDDRPRRSAGAAGGARPQVDAMAGAALGPAFSGDEIERWLTASGIDHRRVGDLDALCATVADALAQGATVGWFRGRMEFGPRALGHRSILADPRDGAVIRRLNQAVKGREAFRPFAPAVLAEEAEAWFDLRGQPSPYMLFTAPLREQRRRSVEPGVGLGFAEQLAQSRSEVPACTHVDHSARVQTVDAARHPDLHALLREFSRRTGIPMVVNTSFNRAGEPIVCTPAQAYECFVATGLDLLVLEDCVIVRSHDDAVGSDAA